MIRALTILVVGLAIGCKGTSVSDPNGGATPVSTAPGDPGEACCMAEPDAQPDPTPVSAPDPAPVPDVGEMTAASLYAQCRDRVEMPEADGECKTSADCGAGGCGGEVCAAVAHGPIMSTCEVRYCFSVLDQCGCVDGRCVWSVKAEVPEGRRMQISPE